MMPNSEFTRLENVAVLPAEGRELHLAADATERRALAGRFGVSEVETLTADLSIECWRKSGLRLRGRVNARIVQACVVSLEPVVQIVQEDIDVTFVPRRRVPAGGNPRAEVIIDPDADEPPEEFDGRSLDIGAIVVEHLTLAIDPYPRSTKAEFAALTADADADGNSKPASPFAALRVLKDKT
jgi:hypothetical protein